MVFLPRETIVASLIPLGHCPPGRSNFALRINHPDLERLIDGLYQITTGDVFRVRNKFLN